MIEELTRLGVDLSATTGLRSRVDISVRQFRVIVTVTIGNDLFTGSAMHLWGKGEQLIEITKRLTEVAVNKFNEAANG